MHLKLSFTFLPFACFLSLLSRLVSSQLILPKEYIASIDDSNEQTQEFYSLPDQRPGFETIDASQRKNYIKQVEGHLLQMFGLTSRPKPGNRNPQVHPYLAHLYSNTKAVTQNIRIPSSVRKRRNVRSINSRVSIQGTHNTVRSHDLKESGHYDPRLLQFDVSLPHGEKLKGAELRLPHSSLLNILNTDHDVSNNNDWHLESHSNETNNINFHRSTRERKRIEVHEVLSDPQNSNLDNQIISRLIDTHVIDIISAKDWSSFDILPAVERWIKDPSINFGIYISVSFANGTRVKDHKFVQNIVPGPLLVTYSNDLKGQEYERVRVKRGTGNRKHRRKGRRDHCRRHPLYVDFSEVGWTDWIVAPHGYQAYFCQGECPYPLDDHLNTTNHAIVQTLVNSVSPTMVPRACCIPTELSAISMLYVDENDKVVLKSYQDMVVEGCGCR